MPLRGPGEMHFSIVMFVVFHMIVCATGTYWDSQSFPMAPGWREIEGCRCQSTSIQLIFFAIIINIPGAPSTPSEEIVVFDPGDYSEQEAVSDEHIAQQDNIVQKENIHPKSENSNLAEARTEYNIAVFKRLFFKKFKSLYFIHFAGWSLKRSDSHQLQMSPSGFFEPMQWMMGGNTSAAWAAPRD